MSKQVPIYDYSVKPKVYPMKPMAPDKVPKAPLIINTWTGKTTNNIPHVGDSTGYKNVPKFHGGVWTGTTLYVHRQGNSSQGNSSQGRSRF